jgi:hypothetical protein
MAVKFKPGGITPSPPTLPAPYIPSPRLNSIITNSFYPPFIRYSSLIARTNSMANLLDKKNSNPQPRKYEETHHGKYTS